MTEQDKQLLTAYNLLKHNLVDKLYQYSCIDDYFGNEDDELKLQLAEKLRCAWLKAYHNVPLIQVADYMYKLHKDGTSFEEILNMDNSDLGDDAFEEYYMSLC